MLGSSEVLKVQLQGLQWTSQAFNALGVYTRVARHERLSRNMVVASCLRRPLTFALLPLDILVLLDPTGTHMHGGEALRTICRRALALSEKQG